MRKGPPEKMRESTRIHIYICPLICGKNQSACARARSPRKLSGFAKSLGPAARPKCITPCARALQIDPSRIESNVDTWTLYGYVCIIRRATGLRARARFLRAPGACAMRNQGKAEAHKHADDRR